MSRPSPKILLQHINKETFRVEQVLESDGLWAVLYKNRPFNLKIGSAVSSYPTPKYKKISFSNPGHAHGLARRLNRLFKTTDFTVVRIWEDESETPQTLSDFKGIPDLLDDPDEGSNTHS